MQLIQFFITYFLFLLASSIAITSFFCVTRGYTEIMPDGSVRKYGKILKGYFFFWYKEKGHRKVYYAGDELAELISKAKEYTSEPMALNGNPFDPQSITGIEASTAISKTVPLLRKTLEVQFEQQPLDNDRITLRAYTTEPEYVFPEWLRTVMAGCITCTPTIYGNITWWSCVLLFRKSVFFHALSDNFSNPLAGLILVWLAYWVSLAWLNTVLWNLYDH